MKLTINTDNGKLTATLEGRLDTLSAVQFETDLQPLMDNADKEIFLDCANLEYISSSGLRCFLRLRKEVNDKGGKLVIGHINDELRNVFTITGLFSLFEFNS